MTTTLQKRLIANSDSTLEAFAAYQELLAINAQIANLEKLKRQHKQTLESAYRSNQLRIKHPSQSFALVRKEEKRKGYPVNDYTFWTYDLIPLS